MSAEWVLSLCAHLGCKWLTVLKFLPQMTEASSCDLERLHTEEVLGYMGNVRFSGLTEGSLATISYFPPCYRACAGCLLQQ